MYLNYLRQHEDVLDNLAFIFISYIKDTRAHFTRRLDKELHPGINLINPVCLTDLTS